MSPPPSDEGGHDVLDESTPSANARDTAQPGKLPGRRPDNMWAGRSAGLECAICGVAVSLDEMEYELEYACNGPHSEVDIYHVHIRCFTARIWRVRDPGARRS